MQFWDAVASAGPYAKSLLLASDRWPNQHLITQCLQGGYSSLRPTNSVKGSNGKSIRMDLHHHIEVFYFVRSAVSYRLSANVDFNL